MLPGLRVAGESSTVATFGVTAHCARMALKCSAFLHLSKVLFPARGPVFSSPVLAPHNCSLCSLWSFSQWSIFCRVAAGALPPLRCAERHELIGLYKGLCVRVVVGSYYCPGCRVQQVLHKYPRHKS